MRFNEVRRDASEDRSGTWDIDDTRRPKLTLRHLNKLRNMKEMAKVEHEHKISGYEGMYSAISDE